MTTGSLMPGTSWRAAFASYEAVRHRLPKAEFKQEPVNASDLDAIADAFDVFLLDAFGVLNIGEQPIPGAVERVASLIARGKHVIVVTNAAGYTADALMAKYRRLGFAFRPEQVVSSRAALLAHLAALPACRWGVMGAAATGTAELPAGCQMLGDETQAYDTADGFLLLGASEWTDDRQTLLIEALRRRRRPVLVGNPDLVAPVEGGLSIEPGTFAHGLADATGIEPDFFGKPFTNVFDLARARMPRGIAPERVVMVGDTLHTDVLGGRAAGFRTALITDFGLFGGADPTEAIAGSGIVPDFILKRT